MKKEYVLPMFECCPLPLLEVLTGSGDPQLPFVPFHNGIGTEDDFIG